MLFSQLKFELLRRDTSLQDHKPWELRKGNEEEVAVCGTVINTSLGLVLLLAALVEPYMPSISAKVKNGAFPQAKCSGLALISTTGLDKYHMFLSHGPKAKLARCLNQYMQDW